MKKSIIFIALATVLTIVAVGLAGAQTALAADGTLKVTFKYGDTTVGTADIASGSPITYSNVPEDPVREGYYFDGWYKEPACTTLWDIETEPVTGDMTLYAGWAQEQTTAEGIKYVHNYFYGGYVITGYSGTAGAVQIPFKIGETLVYEISPGALLGNETITSVTFPTVDPSDMGTGYKGISLNWVCFGNCPNLASVYLANTGVISDYPQHQFEDDFNLSSITCDPESPFHTVQDRVLFSKDLSELVAFPPNLQGSVYPGPVVSYSVPAGTVKIRGTAFNSCRNLEIINIPASIDEIGRRAFTGCTNLDSIMVDAGNSSFESTADYVLLSKDGSTLWAYPGGKYEGGGAYTIPASVRTVKFGAFEYCTGLKSITIPATVTNIEMDTTDGLLSNPFAGCSNLTQIIIEPGSPILAAQSGVLYSKDSTALISYPAGRTPDEPAVTKAAGYSAEYKAREGNYTVPDGTTSIEYRAFTGTYLATVTIPNSVTFIDDEAFYLAAGVTICGHKGSYAEGYAKAHNMFFLSIDTPTDYDANIVSGKAIITGYHGTAADIVIPSVYNGFPVTGIQTYAFLDKSFIRTVTIPASVSDIGPGAFVGCGGITSYSVEAGNACYKSADGMIYSADGKAIVAFPSARTGEFAVPSGVSIGIGAFANTHLTTVKFPQDLTSIGDYAFANSDTLQRAIFYGDVFNPNAGHTVSNAFTQGLSSTFRIYYHVSRAASWAPYAYSGVPFTNLTLSLQDGSAPKTDVAPLTNGHIDTPASPARTNYTFAGWYVDVACTAAWDPAAAVTADITLYAKWTPTTFTIGYNLNGGNADNPASYTVESASFTLNNPTRYGYNFAGWTGTGLSEASMNVTVPAGSTGDRTYTANWNTQGQSNYLAGVISSSGSISPAFNKSKTNYKITIGENDASFTLTPVKEYDGATMTINKQNASSLTLPIANGKSVKFTVKVMLGKKPMTYTFTVTRPKSTNNALASLTATAGTWSQPFDPNVTNYTLTLDENTKSTAIKGAAASGKLASVSPASAKVTLNNGQSKAVKITVKAQSGAKRTYTITVVRAASTNADLKSLKAKGLTPGFNPAQTSYSITLPANKSSVGISAKAAGYKAAVSIDGLKKPSKNVTVVNGQAVTVHITVMAQAGNTKEYVITVTRL